MDRIPRSRSPVKDDKSINKTSILRQRLSFLNHIINDRPPLLPRGLDAPSTQKYLFNEYNSSFKPIAISFGSKDAWPEHDHTGRTCWQKTWFKSPYVWTLDVGLGELKWPSPNNYDPKIESTKYRGPSFTFGFKRKISNSGIPIKNTESIMTHSSITQPLKIENADPLRFKKILSYSFNKSDRQTILWKQNEFTPSPTAYDYSLTRSKGRSFTVYKRDLKRTAIYNTLGPFGAN